MAITTAVTDLLRSAAELLASVFHAAYAIAHAFGTGIAGLLAGFAAFVGDVGSGVLDLTSGVGKFVAGNAAVLLVIAAAGYAYVRFVQMPQQRKPVTANGVGAGKKTN